MDVLLWQVHVQTLQSLSPATVLQKLCLFNCKLDQEAAEQLVTCLEDGGFTNLQELDLTGNNIEAPQMQALLQTLQHRDRAPSLKVKCVLGLSQQSCYACMYPVVHFCMKLLLPIPLNMFQVQHHHNQHIRI